MKLLLSVVLSSSSLLACSSPGAPRGEQTVTPDALEEQRLELEEFGQHYHYDVGYLIELLELSPASYVVFEGAMALAEHREHLPLEAHYVARIAALQADDCGACTQLNLRLAVEAGVDRALLRTLLEDPAALPGPLRAVHAHAQQVVRGDNADAQRVAELREAYGEAAFAELAVVILGSRIYPGLRRALGAERTCPPPHLDF
jgi:hypothetical protein